MSGARRVFVTVSDLGTGEVLRELGPYPDAREGRLAASQEAGQPLTWQRTPDTWSARSAALASQVLADAAAEERADP